ncbi:MAG: ABC transporter permease [Vicinamibacterales bacterium]
MIDRMSRQLRYAVRVLWRAPFFTLTAALSLTIGLGANTTIFTIANALVLAPTRGVARMHELVDLGRTDNGSGFDTVSYPTYVDLRDRNTVFSGMYAVRFEPRPVSLGGTDGADRAYSQQVSASYFEVLGVPPALGRFFSGSDERLGVPLRQVVLSYAYWRVHFSGDAGVIGRDLVLNGEHFTVIGVAPEGHTSTTILAPDLWVPLTSYALGMPTDDLLRGRQNSWLVMGARLKPGVTIAQARTEMSALMAGLAREYPEPYRGKGIGVAPSSRLPGELGQFAVPFLAVLSVVVGLVLLVACTNLAGIMLARAASRSREVAVRLALGASRGQLVSQFLTESLLVFAVGGAGALLVSRVMTRVLVSFLPALPVPISVDFALDGRVFAFGMGLTLAAGLLTGLAPALQSTRASVVNDLKKDSAGAGRHRLRNGFVAAQMALCLVLLVSAGLFLRAFDAALAVKPGFDVDPIDVAVVDLSLRGYPDGQVISANGEIRDRLAALPGIANVAVGAVAPLGGDGLGLGDLRLAGASRPVGSDTDWNVISPEFFDTLALPIVRGRAFTAADRAGAPDVAIVNETMARRLWPGADAIGQRLEAGDFRPGHEKVDRVYAIVGVAHDAKYRWLGDGPRNFLYVPIAQQPWRTPVFFVRRDARLASATTLSSAIRGALKEVDPDVPLVTVLPLREMANLGLLPQRLAASVAGSLGFVALLLAAIGLYGVTAFTVARRTREIGLRVALGASERGITTLIVGQAVRLTALGGGIGLVVAVAATRVLSGLLFGVSPLDPIAFGATTGALMVVAIVASYVPARRAARVNPVVALRAE